MLQRTMPHGSDLYGRTKGPMGPRPGMEEMDFSDDDATPLTEPIYSGRSVHSHQLPLNHDHQPHHHDHYLHNRHEHIHRNDHI